MIAEFDDKSGAWVASGNGNLRPIVVEGGSRREVVKAYGEVFLHQQSEEYHYEQSMSQILDADYNYPGEDLG